MKKISLGLGAAIGLAAATVALAAPASALPSVAGQAGGTVYAPGASHPQVVFGQVGPAPLGRCMVIDVAAPVSGAADRNPAKQVLPSWCA
jgi:hypothetical protein